MTYWGGGGGGEGSGECREGGAGSHVFLSATFTLAHTNPVQFSPFFALRVKVTSSKKMKFMCTFFFVWLNIRGKKKQNRLLNNAMKREREGKKN